MTHFLPVIFFGALGVLSRYEIDKLWINESENFPVSTLLVNVIGCLLAGIIYSLSERYEWPQSLQLGLLVGFCGGFTTFSAYALQTFQMMEKGKLGVAFFYWGTSPIISLAALILAIKSVKYLVN